MENKDELKEKECWVILEIDEDYDGKVYKPEKVTNSWTYVTNVFDDYGSALVQSENIINEEIETDLSDGFKVTEYIPISEDDDSDALYKFVKLYDKQKNRTRTCMVKIFKRTRGLVVKSHIPNESIILRS